MIPWPTTEWPSSERLKEASRHRRVSGIRVSVGHGIQSGAERRVKVTVHGPPSSMTDE